MSGDQYIGSKARKEICDLLKRCGPLTVVQIDKLRRKAGTNSVMRWLVNNGHVGVLPTYPAKFVIGAVEYKHKGMSECMSEVMEALRKFGPATSLQIGQKIGKDRECIDVYFRHAKARGEAHRCGEVKTVHKMTAYVWAVGPGENYVRKSMRRNKSRTAKKKAAPTVIIKTSNEMPRQPTQVIVRRDPFIAALFGDRAAA
jgi:hypothetical protein